MKKKSLGSKIFARRVLLFIQLLASILLAVSVYFLGILPRLYYAFFIGLEGILFVLTWWLTKKRKMRAPIKLVCGKILNIGLSLMMIISSVYIILGNNLLSEFGLEFDEHTISVIVLKDGKYKELEELKDKPLAANYNVGTTILANGIEIIEKEIGVMNIKEIDSYESLAKALYDKDVDAIIINEANRYMIKEVYDNFSIDTKVIYKTKVKSEITNITKANITEETFTIYISGNDEYDEDSPLYEPDNMGGSAKRSDVNMLVTINPKKKQVLLTTIPRDTFVKLASSQGSDKLTHVSLNGVNEAMDTLEQIFDCEINYYFKINFSSLINIIDAMGGITVNNPTAFTSGLDASSGVGEYFFDQGEIELDGFKALVYSRERHVFAEGDNMRGRNQQRVLSSIINKATSATIITRYTKVLSAIEGSFESTLTDSEIKSFIQMQLNDMASWDIQSIQVTGEEGYSTKCMSMPGQKLSVLFPDEESIKKINKYIKQMEKNEEIQIQEQSTNY